VTGTGNGITDPTSIKDPTCMGSKSKGGIEKTGLIRALGLFLATCLLAVMAGCAGTLDKPTTPGNAGTSALVAYSVAGFTAGQYLAFPLCANPPVYPCKTQEINDKLVAADAAAYAAAKAADAAGDPSRADPEIGELKSLNALPEVRSQIQLKKEAHQ
jgi:hypothetical protein